MNETDFILGLLSGSGGVIIVGALLARLMSGTPWRLLWREEVLEARYAKAEAVRDSERRIAKLEKALGIKGGAP